MAHVLLLIIYLSFISLGLPDALLGSAWPVMYGPLGVPVSYAGLISMIISGGTILSSLLSDRLTRRLGAGKVTLISVGMTALALFGFSVSGSFWLLCFWAVPYGLGAGSVDAALNNYVALHYSSRHMSWLHCMWGVGASAGPWLMGQVLTRNLPWTLGYRLISLLQVLLTAAILFSLPLWNKQCAPAGQAEPSSGPHSLTLGHTLRLPGVKAAMATYFFYCAIEQTAGLWASSYLTLCRAVPSETAAGFAGLFFLGITLGRGAGGFLAAKLNDTQLVRLGFGIQLAGNAALLFPLGEWAALAGLVLMGLGCAPVYPCLMHAAPIRFGARHSQAVIGLQMASAYAGVCLMPPLFGLLANRISPSLFPLYLLVLLVLMVGIHERMLHQTKA